ncbi:Uncharacterised protein [uncultured Blautia sp.]|nr:Uncharacterised protein [uncultured Blautia sp.]
MAGGRADAAVRVDGHNVQVAEGEYLRIRTQLGVHQLQQLIRAGHHVGLIVVIGAAPAGCGPVGHGDKLHVLHAQPTQNRLLGKP